MDFQPPADPNDLEYQNGAPEYNCSPMLRPNNNLSVQNLPRPHSYFRIPQPYNSQSERSVGNAGIRNRLGPTRRSLPYPSGKQAQPQGPKFNGQGQTFGPLRKRPAEAPSPGPNRNKRFMVNDRSFQRPQNHISAQNRLNKIRSQSMDNLQTFQVVAKQETVEDLDEDFDTTDITVSVPNMEASTSSGAPFKMTLDPKIQKAIHVIQSKRKEKQVVFPFPVKPNVTGVSVHERFTSL